MLESNDLRQSNDRARLGSMVFTSLGRKSELIGSANQPRHFSPLRQSRAELHLAV